MGAKISKLFKKHRIRKGLSQEELAEALGCHPMQISQIEREGVELPRKYLKRVEDEMEISHGDLVDILVDDYIEEVNKTYK